MPDSSNTPELYERVVKIKELPMKESVTPDSVLLIEDDEDTKQMPVTAFYDLIDNISKQALNMVRAKLEELDSYLENSGLDGIADLIKQIEEAEKARVEAEKEREANEQDRESTFNGWKNTFDKTWKPAIEDAIKQALNIILNALKGCIPEFPEYGLSNEFIGTTVNAIQYPVIFKDLMNMFQRDSRWSSVELLDVYTEEDAVFLKIQAETVTKTDYLANVPINRN